MDQNNQPIWNRVAVDLEAVQKELDAWLLSIPNLPHEDVLGRMKPKTSKSGVSAPRANLILKSNTMSIWANLWVWIGKRREISKHDLP